uniref:Uncharacterized protein n=1 Tax=Setaria italica TaxID=4555 RepID=K3YBJ3_SETIT
MFRQGNSTSRTSSAMLFDRCPAKTVGVILIASRRLNWLHTDSEVELTEDWGRYAAIARIV